MDFSEMTNEEVFILRRQVNAEYEKRMAKQYVIDNLKTALSGVSSETEADAVYNTVKAELFE